MAQQVISTQPVPAPVAFAATGLDILQDLETLTVKQQKEWLEIFTGWETDNKYQIFDKNGMPIAYAAEDTNFCVANCLGSDRPFHMTVISASGQPIMKMDANYNCCGQRVDVEAPPGNLVGYVRKAWAPCRPTFYMCLPDGKDVFIMQSSFAACLCKCCSDVHFNIRSTETDRQIGRISKKWTGILTESFTDADHFKVEFPVDMDVRWKAILLAALFLIDFTFYEKAKDGNKRFNH